MNSLILDTIMINNLLINNQEVTLHNLSIYSGRSQPVNNETIYFNKVFDSTSNSATSDYGSILIFRSSKYMIIFNIERIDFILHNGSFTLDLIVDDNIIQSVEYCGPGRPNPSYGFENIYFSDSSTDIIKIIFKFRNVSNILNVFSNVTLLTSPI